MRELSEPEIRHFIHQGYVRVDAAFPADLAERGRTLLWRDTGCDPANPATWTRPVIRLGNYGGEPFSSIVNTPVLLRAYDQLAGPGRWRPRDSLGMFLVRFPSRQDPGDAGWHIDTSFTLEEGVTDYFDWRVNVVSRGRALLMLFLLSDVAEQDAPTRIRVGSHLEMARVLAPAGERGRSLRELAAGGFVETRGYPETLATGPAGTVYLCHPFLVHAAQPHRGTRPRFLAQPPLLPGDPFLLERPDGAYSPVEQAIRLALGRGAID